MQEHILSIACAGRVRAFQVRPDGLWLPTTDWRANTVVYEWGAIVARLLAQGDIAYKLSAMYLEFSNGEAPRPVPSLDRTRNIDYYQGLTGTYDYLRVPLRSATISSSNTTLFPNGNQIVFTAKSGGEGLVGEAQGLAFSSVAGSQVIGAALVAEVSEVDASQDLVFSAFYFAEAEQQAKLLASEVGLDWELTLI